MTKRRTIVITGVCGGLGRVLLRRLMEEPDIDVVGVDKRNWVLDRPDRFRFERADLRRSHAEDVIRTARPWALVHLAFVSDQRVSQGKRHDVNVVGTSKVLGWARHHGAKRVCVLSRAAVYGARPDNPSLITEDMPLKLGAAWSESSDLVEYDHLCRSWMWEHRDVEMTVLRPVHLVGRNIREGLLHQLLRRDPVPMALGFDPMIQLVHEEDVVEAITLALTRGARGIYNVPGPGQLPLSRILDALGRRVLPLPHPIWAAADRLAFMLRRSALSSAAIDFLRYSCLVDGTRIAEELGYEPKHGLKATIAAIPGSSSIVA